MATAPSTNVTPDEVARRTIRRADLVAAENSFIDCRTPGSERKLNYAIIGSGVSEGEQFVNLTIPHGFQLGGASMPPGVNNSLHMHFTAEVFIVASRHLRVPLGTRLDRRRADRPPRRHHLDAHLGLPRVQQRRRRRQLHLHDPRARPHRRADLGARRAAPGRGPRPAPHHRQPPHRHGGRRGRDRARRAGAPDRTRARRGDAPLDASTTCAGGCRPRPTGSSATTRCCARRSPAAAPASRR